MRALILTYLLLLVTHAASGKDDHVRVKLPTPEEEQAEFNYALDSMCICFMTGEVWNAQHYMTRALRAAADSNCFIVYQCIEAAVDLANGKVVNASPKIERAVRAFSSRTDSIGRKYAAFAYCTKAMAELKSLGSNSEYYFNLACDNMLAAGCPVHYLHCSVLYTEILIEQARYADAADRLRQLQQIPEIARDEDMQFLLRLQLLKIYSDLRAVNMAQNYIEEIDRSSALDNMNNEARYLMNKVDFLLRVDKQDEALAGSQRLMQIMELFGTPLNLWKATIQQAKVYAYMHRTDEAREVIKQCRQQLRHITPIVYDSNYSIDNLPMIEAWIALVDGRYDEAFSKLSEIDPMLYRGRSLENACAYYKCLENAYVATHQWPQAIDALNNFNEVQDRIRAHSIRQRSIDMDRAYKNNATILAQRSTLAQNEKTVSTARSRSMQVFMLTAFALLVIILFRTISKRRSEHISTLEVVEQRLDFEREVARKTEALRTQNAELRAKNTDILLSQSYAKRIQNGMLPPDQMLHTGSFHNAFIIYRPLDIVSGDFYWFHRHGTRLTICCADGAEHGVPGALMSMVGMAALSDIVHRFRNSTASAMLEALHEKMVKLMPKLEGRDGIDMSIAIIDTLRKEVNIAAARQNVVMIIGGHAQLVKGTPRHIGDTAEPFINHHFTDTYRTLRPGDALYLYTDGITNLFGGTSNEKLKTPRLIEILSKINRHAPAEQENRFRRIINEWHGNCPENDDILLIGITF